MPRRSSPVLVLVAGPLLALAAVACSDSGGGSPRREEPVLDGVSSDQSLQLEAVSTRPEYVTGGDVLVAIRSPVEEGPLSPAEVIITRDGAPVDVTWRDDGADRGGDGPGLLGLVSGLPEGPSELEARIGDRTAALAVVSHPLTGPVFSGPHLPLEACSTETYGLGPPTDEDCSAAPVVAWSYVDTEGQRRPLDDPTVLPADVAFLADGTTPFVLREERGTRNRAVYWITVLDPEPAPDGPWDPGAWNGRLVYEFGGGCGVTYSQGFKLLGEPDLAVLAAGYAHATATFNTFQVTCNATLSAETTMMVEEHFAETYALPALVIGAGGSGGAIQQLQLVQNYPGLLDAAGPTLPFPDAISIATDVVDCGLLSRAFGTEAASGLSPEAARAVTGHLSAQTCDFWEATFVPNVDPRAGCTLDLLSGASELIEGLAGVGVPPGIDDGLAYDAETNPDGLRCTLQDGNVNIVGRDPDTGFARRPWDNQGVQYGLGALAEGAITFEEFVTLNEGIGSFDIDGDWVPERAVVDEDTIATAYAQGLVNQGGGDLRRIPVIEVDVWTDDQGDIHTRDRAFAVRERVRLPDGSLPPNLMLWTRGLPGGDNLVDSLTGSVGLGLEVVATLDEWATAVAAAVPEREAASDEELAEVLAATRPEAAVDNCLDAEGARVSGLDVYEGSGPCTDPYPVSDSPRTVAGAPLRNDILKCALQPVAAAVEAGSYGIELSDAEVARLQEVFPDGVCDWTRPGIGMVPMADTWLDYGSG